MRNLKPSHTKNAIFTLKIRKENFENTKYCNFCFKNKLRNKNFENFTQNIAIFALKIMEKVGEKKITQNIAIFALKNKGGK